MKKFQDSALQDRVEGMALSKHKSQFVFLMNGLIMILTHTKRGSPGSNVPVLDSFISSFLVEIAFLILREIHSMDFLKTILQPNPPKWTNSTRSLSNRNIIYRGRCSDSLIPSITSLTIAARRDLPTVLDPDYF